MNKKLISSLMLFVVFAFAGCGSKQMITTGFLSDYSKLQVKSDNALRYVNKQAAKKYTKFIIDPVAIHFHSKSKIAKKAKPEDLQKLQQYFYGAIVKALKPDYEVVFQAGPGVARVKIAITDLAKSNVVLNAIPQTKLSGVGLGGATMEAEIVDTITGEQIAAVVHAQKGSRISLAGLKTWGYAEAVMDDWAKRFRKRLDEVHGK